MDLDCFISVQTSLKSFPNCIHLHIKKQNEKSGTLELTQLASGEAWLTVHKNRRAPWIDDVVRQIT
jgi:hypothetical protein